MFDFKIWDPSAFTAPELEYLCGVCFFQHECLVALFFSISAHLLIIHTWLLVVVAHFRHVKSLYVSG